MKNKRLRNYLNARNKNRPAGKNSIRIDAKTDQDFPGYPHGSSSEKHITPSTMEERKLAAVNTKDGEKMLQTNAKQSQQKNEIESDGSGGAFDGTEKVRE